MLPLAQQNAVIRIMSRSVLQALKNLTDGKALSIIKQVEKGNGFEAWRRLWAEYRPNIAGRKVSLLEQVMVTKPAEGESFSDFYSLVGAGANRGGRMATTH